MLLISTWLWGDKMEQYNLPSSLFLEKTGTNSLSSLRLSIHLDVVLSKMSSIHIDVFSSIVITQVLFKQLHYWDFMGEASLSCLEDMSRRHYLYSRCSSPLDPTAFHPLSLLFSELSVHQVCYRSISGRWSSNSHLFSVPWLIVDLFSSLYIQGKK